MPILDLGLLLHRWINSKKKIWSWARRLQLWESRSLLSAEPFFSEPCFLLRCPTWKRWWGEWRRRRRRRGRGRWRRYRGWRGMLACRSAPHWLLCNLLVGQLPRRRHHFRRRWFFLQLFLTFIIPGYSTCWWRRGGGRRDQGKHHGKVTKAGSVMAFLLNFNLSRRLLMWCRGPMGDVLFQQRGAGQGQMETEDKGQGQRLMEELLLCPKVCWAPTAAGSRWEPARDSQITGEEIFPFPFKPVCPRGRFPSQEHHHQQVLQHKMDLSPLHWL